MKMKMKLWLGLGGLLVLALLVWAFMPKPAEVELATVTYVVDGGHARQREIEVAARNGTEAWVKTGLTPGMQVVAYPPSSLKDGARIKAR